MIDDWLEVEEIEQGARKALYMLKELNGVREAVKAELLASVRSHYDDPASIADDIEELGFEGAAAILRERLPTKPKARSGEVGEILATELIEYLTEYTVPVRRLRYKDGREMALRGDDFIGLQIDGTRLKYIKGESKSGKSMSASVITTARERLNDDNGRPTAISLLFVADRLLERDGDEKKIGRSIRNEVALGIIKASNVTHGLFTFTGNNKLSDLKTDLDGAASTYKHLSINVRITDHQDFIAWVYQGAEELGND